jgi:hypothetical protein
MRFTLYLGSSLLGLQAGRNEEDEEEKEAILDSTSVVLYG